MAYEGDGLLTAMVHRGMDVALYPRMVVTGPLSKGTAIFADRLRRTTTTILGQNGGRGAQVPAADWSISTKALGRKAEDAGVLLRLFRVSDGGPVLVFDFGVNGFFLVGVIAPATEGGNGRRSIKV